MVSVTAGSPEPIVSALTLKDSLPLTRPLTFRIVNVWLVVLVTLRWRGRREATARVLPWLVILKFEIVKLSSGLAHVRAICSDLVLPPMLTAWVFEAPALSLSVKVCGGVWQVIDAPMLFITACSWLESVSG